MQIDAFVQSRQREWQQLDELLDRCQQDVHQLSPDDVRTLARLYRATTSDLALTQRDFPGHRVTAYLNQLVARGHAAIYRSEPLSLGRLWRFAAAGFPCAYRQTFRFVAAAALMLFLPALLAGALTLAVPDSSRWFMPAGFQDLIPGLERQELWTDIPIDERPYTATFIMQNNIQVAFLAFAGGVLAGLPTVWVLINNGLILGGVTGLASHYGVGFDLWTFVIGHGVIELSVITIAGGAGLMLGFAILRPGLASRRDSLAQAARAAVRLIVGCVPLLLVAGAIEGFLSPAESLPWPVKWGVGLVSGVLLYSYLFLAGRTRVRKP